MATTFGQTRKSVSLYLNAQFNKTIYDRTIANNPWGAGFGLQLFANAGSLRPTLDITADAYLEDDKVLRLNTDGTPTEELEGMINVFVGAQYDIGRKGYFSFTTGPSFTTGRTVLGIKPSLGLYLTRNQKWIGKLSWITLFDRDRKSGQDFGALTLSVGFKLF